MEIRPFGLAMLKAIFDREHRALERGERVLEDDGYAHAVTEDTELGLSPLPTTLCGITPEVQHNVYIACPCGHPECEKPVTCPVCKALADGTLVIN